MVRSSMLQVNAARSVFSQDFPWFSTDFRGFSVDFHGFSMDFRWMSVNFKGFPRIFHGVSMDFCGFSIDFHCFSMDFQWISADSLGISPDFHGFSMDFLGFSLDSSLIFHGVRRYGHALSSHNPMAAFLCKASCHDLRTLTQHFLFLSCQKRPWPTKHPKVQKYNKG